MPSGPGNISWSMPPQADDLVRAQTDLERAQREANAAQTLTAAQFGKGGILVNGGGSITIQDGGSLSVLGSGSINVPSGGLNSAGSISAVTTITAGGTITSTGGGVNVAGQVSGSSLAIGGSGTLSGGLSAGGNVSASGQVISAGVINSPGTRANTVTVGYQSLWADSAGNFGANTSSRRYKQDITPVETNVAGFLGLTTYKFRYKANVEALGDEAPWDYGLIAEEVVQVAPWACFFEDDGVTVKGINYDRLVVALLNVAQDHEARIAALEGKD